MHDDDIFLAVLRMRIRQLRIARGLNQEAAAERANLPLRSYQRFEAASRRQPFNPTLRKLLAVARALNVELAALLAPPTAAEVAALQDPPDQRRVYKQ